MKLYNTLSRKIEELRPLKAGAVSLYSCGPTVYDHVHIGNWRAFVFADTMRRALKLAGLKVTAVMNITDVDDKTIHRAVKEKVELEEVTRRYEQIYLDETTKLGIDMDTVKNVRATDELDSMRALIEVIHAKGFAYLRDDGVYFSVSKYLEKYSYGVLSNIVVDPSKLQQRIDNDEYDKDDARDFALWKKSDPGEPSWDLELEEHTLSGRPGWHIECSAMSAKYLGQPFDIHSGGVDLIFPHHENEIAQSKAANGQDLANFFVHNEHLLVDGKKMSKSLGNFYTLVDIEKKGFDPLALRLLFLQSHYRSQQNFTWESLEAAQNFLNNLRAWADLRHQPSQTPVMDKQQVDRLENELRAALADDLDTPRALAQTSAFVDKAAPSLDSLKTLDTAFGLGLGARSDIDASAKALINERKDARAKKDFELSDKLRHKLKAQKIEIEDTPHGPRWRRI